jgi:hypothetical protein
LAGPTAMVSAPLLDSGTIEFLRPRVVRAANESGHR